VGVVPGEAGDRALGVLEADRRRDLERERGRHRLGDDRVAVAEHRPAVAALRAELAIDRRRPPQGRLGVDVAEQPGDHAAPVAAVRRRRRSPEPPRDDHAAIIAPPPAPRERRPPPHSRRAR
jgi:hypothetical protein